MIIYRSKDGKIIVSLMNCDGNVWLNQAQIATLFATSKQNVGQHISNILKENELDANSGGCVIIDYGHLWCTLLLYIV